MATAQQPIRVLTVDDHALLRKGIRALIGAESSMQVVAEASTGAGTEAELTIPAGTTQERAKESRQ